MTLELSWRRLWKPDLRASPWQQLTLDDNKYLIKSRFDDDSYEILVTNLTRFWYENLKGEKLKNRVNMLNPCFEAPLAKILDLIKENITKEDEETRLILKKSDDLFVLEISSQLAGMPFSYSFEAELASNEMGRDHLTVPLLVMVAELQRQQNELYKILEAKDKEINDYKCHGGKTSRKYLQTSPFDNVAFHNNMITSKDFECEVKSFWEKTFTLPSQELYREIATKQAYLQSSPVKNELVTTDESITERISDPSVESWSNRIPASVIGKHNSPNKASLENSPVKSPASSKDSSNETTPKKDDELIRRQTLERKLEMEAAREQEKVKKKRKLKL
ncbi:hypothetical protein Btru_057265 [Bulinus truncatus]|nr:hypothetical protein Btru_057265 [Bulinus truncatus]